MRVRVAGVPISPLDQFHVEFVKHPDGSSRASAEKLLSEGRFAGDLGQKLRLDPAQQLAGAVSPVHRVAGAKANGFEYGPIRLVTPLPASPWRCTAATPSAGF